MKRNAYNLTASVLTASLLGTLAVPSIAHAELSANIGAVSNYMFRGLTQTEGASAIQGGVDYEDASGLYAGTWVPTIDFGAEATHELDLYFGFAGDVEGIAYDVGYIYYAYIDAPDNIDFGEIYGEIGLGNFAVGIAYTAHSENQDNVFDEGDIYYYGSASLPLADDFSASFTVGYYDFDVDGKAGFEDASYVHYSASLAKDASEFGEFSLNVDYADISKSDAPFGSPRADKPQVWVGWTKSF